VVKVAGALRARARVAEGRVDPCLGLNSQNTRKLGMVSQGREEDDRTVVYLFISDTRA
jgi:hypothetical protein